MPGFVDVLWLLLAALAWLAIEVLFRGLTVDRASARFLAPWYIGMPLGMLAAIHAVGGRMATLLLIATVIVSDTAQYYSGRAFGRRPLAPAISPKKTIEGAVGGWSPPPVHDGRRPHGVPGRAAGFARRCSASRSSRSGSAATCSNRGSSAWLASRTAPR